MKIEEHLKEVDLDDLIDRLTKYAYDRLKSHNIKDFEGKEPIDFVSDVLCKSLEGIRNFENAQCSIGEFMFGCLKSDIDSFFKKRKNIANDEPSGFLSVSIVDSATDLKKKVIHQLELEGATAEEILIFELWTDGIDKPNVIAKELGLSSNDIYNATKRLNRRLNAVRPLIEKQL